MIIMRKNKKKRFKRKNKIRKTIKKEIPKISLKKKKNKIISKQKDQPKEQSLFQPLIKAYERYREKLKIEKLKQVNIVGKEREQQIEKE